MNTAMADGASERLDAQIADALFGQPGMSKLEVANRLRELRRDGGPLLGDAGNPVSLSPSGHRGLNYERMFVDACAALAEVSRELGCDPEQGGAEPILAAIAELREALAARQPEAAAVKDSLTVGGGQAVSNAIDMGYWGGPHIGLMLNKDWPEHSGRVYLGAPAQAVGLGQFRQAVVHWYADADNANTSPEWVREEADRLLALIDSKASAGEPNTAPNRLTAGVAASIMHPWEFRDALLWAEDSADCSSHPNHKAYRFAFTELLAMIGSEEVGR